MVSMFKKIQNVVLTTETESCFICSPKAASNVALKFVFTGNFLKSHFNILNEKTNYFNSLLDLVLVDSPLNKKLIIQRKGVLKRFKDLENYHLFGKCFRKVLILKVFSGHNIKNY